MINESFKKKPTSILNQFLIEETPQWESPKVEKPMELKKYEMETQKFYESGAQKQGSVLD